MTGAAGLEDDADCGRCGTATVALGGGKAVVEAACDVGPEEAAGGAAPAIAGGRCVHAEGCGCGTSHAGLAPAEGRDGGLNIRVVQIRGRKVKKEGLASRGEEQQYRISMLARRNWDCDGHDA